jgi:hypothetical protein
MSKLNIDSTTLRKIDEAYHGTLLEDAYTIIKEGKFIPTKKPDSYLGDGVYFYEYSRWLAAKWVERNHGKHVSLGIICACVDYGKCLNLDTPEHRKILKKVREQMSQRPEIRLKGIKITDALVINYYAENITKDLDTIRFTYVNVALGRLYEGSAINDYVQPMLCVRNDNKIEKISLVFEGSGYHE